MRRIYTGIALVLSMGSVSAEPMVSAAAVREAIEVRTSLALQYGEKCFIRVQVLLLGYEAKLQKKDLGESTRNMPKDEFTALFRAGYRLRGLTDPLIDKTYASCIDEIRPILEP